MRPRDINKIASTVVGSLAGLRDAGLLGCGAISSPELYDWEPGCQVGVGCEGRYECGGWGLFTCCEGFTCLGVFVCPAPAGFLCENDILFTCTIANFDKPGCGDAFSTLKCCHRFE